METLHMFTCSVISLFFVQKILLQMFCMPGCPQRASQCSVTRKVYFGSHLQMCLSAVLCVEHQGQEPMQTTAVHMRCLGWKEPKVGQDAGLLQGYLLNLYWAPLPKASTTCQSTTGCDEVLNTWPFKMFRLSYNMP